MKSQQILLIGAGGHARSCIDVIESGGEFEIVGLIGRDEEVGSKVLGYEVLGTDKDLLGLSSHVNNAVIAVGQTGISDLRGKLFSDVSQLGFKSPVIVSPLSYVSPHASIGSGTVVLHRSLVNAGAIIGYNCIINSFALIEHDVTVEDNCHIATGATINGSSRIGSGSLIGSGSNILQNIQVGRNCIVGMGASLKSDLGSGAIYFGREQHEC